MREHLHVFFELNVALLELRLLGFQAGLAVAKHIALLFELFVADAQLFLLSPQLLRLPLSRAQQLFALAAQASGANRDAHRLAQQLQQLQIGATDGFDEAQLQRSHSFRRRPSLE